MGLCQLDSKTAAMGNIPQFSSWQRCSRLVLRMEKIAQTGNQLGKRMLPIWVKADSIPAPFFIGTSTPLAAAENRRKLSCTRLQHSYDMLGFASQPAAQTGAHAWNTAVELINTC